MTFTLLKPLAPLIPPRRVEPPIRIYRGRSERTVSPFKVQSSNIDPTDHYAKSQLNWKDPPIQYLRAFADSLFCAAALRRITNGVSQMPIYVLPPDDLKEDEAALEIARRNEAALSRPNVEEADSYGTFVGAIIKDLLTCNLAFVLRSPGLEGSDRPFWLWYADPSHVRYNKDWSPQVEGVVPRYYYTQGKPNQRDWQPLLSREAFTIQRSASSYQVIPPSSIQIAFKLIAAWVGLTDWQSLTTSRSTQEYILDIGEVTPAELENFRIYFKEKVIDEGEAAILGSKGKGVNVVKLGAKTDEGLFLKYEEKLIRLIALSFDLNPRDFNVGNDESYATADVSADDSSQNAVLPVFDALIERWNLDVVGFFSPGYQVKSSNRDQRDEGAEADRATLLKGANIITLNEARMASGYSSLGQPGEVFADGSSPADVGEAELEQSILVEAGKRQPPLKRFLQWSLNNYSYFEIWLKNLIN